jgi:hypothetical protein
MFKKGNDKFDRDIPKSEPEYKIQERYRWVDGGLYYNILDGFNNDSIVYRINKQYNHVTVAIDKTKKMNETSKAQLSRELLIDYTQWLSKQKFEKYSSNMVDAYLNNNDK